MELNSGGKSLELHGYPQHKLMDQEDYAEDEWETTSDHWPQDVDLGGSPKSPVQRERSLSEGLVLKM